MSNKMIRFSHIRRGSSWYSSGHAPLSGNAARGLQLSAFPSERLGLRLMRRAP